MASSLTKAPGLRRFTVDEYHRMGEADVFRPDERVELIHGVIREMTPKGRKHVFALTKCNEAFTVRLAGRARVFVQDPLGLKKLESEPEPDIAIQTSLDLEAYGTDDARIGLIIEIAASSLEYDREVKARLYAEAEIEEYWIVNLLDETIEIHLDPAEGAYQRKRIAKRDETVTPSHWDDLTIPVEELLP